MVAFDVPPDEVCVSRAFSIYNSNKSECCVEFEMWADSRLERFEYGKRAGPSDELLQVLQPFKASLILS